MGRLFLAEGEDLVARFHPHRASYLGRYLTDLLWAFYGVLAYIVGASGYSTPLGAIQTSWLILPLAAAAHTAVEFWATASTRYMALAWTVASFALLVLAGAGKVPADHAALPFYALGVALGLLALLRREWEHNRCATHITTRRIVVQRGLARMVERTIPLGDVQGVRAVQTPMGQAFRYATILLTVPTRRRNDPEAGLELVAVPRFDEVKHRLETALQELRMPKREREKRTDERRLKDSMRALADWASHETR